MVTAGVTAAGMTFAVSVMVTGGVGVLCKVVRKEILYRFIGPAHISVIKRNACLLHSHLSSAADTSADEYIDLCVFQESCQSTVSRAVCACDLFIYYFSVGNIVELELLCSAEMLENLSVFI